MQILENNAPAKEDQENVEKPWSNSVRVKKMKASLRIQSNGRIHKKVNLVKNYSFASNSPPDNPLGLKIGPVWWHNLFYMS